MEELNVFEKVTDFLCHITEKKIGFINQDQKPKNLVGQDLFDNIGVEFANGRA